MGTFRELLGERLFAAAPGPKTWVLIPAADHNDWLTDEYLLQLDRFLKQLPR